MQKEAAQLFFVPPMECREVKQLREIPRGSEWQYEIKWDGYRCIAIKQKGDVELYSRNGKAFTQFPNLFDVIRQYRAKSFILDGEIVALDEDGRSNFNDLQRAKSKPIDVHFYAFDLLNLEGKNMLDLPLQKRQALLWRRFPQGTFFHHSPAIEGEVEAIAEKIEELGLEGIVAKNRHSIYTPGKTPGSWIKRKLKQSDEFIVGGYVPSNAGVESILVGRYSGKKFMFVEDVDDGFIPATRREVFKAIQKLKIEECPFDNLPEKKGVGRMDKEKMQEVSWVKPKLVVEIAMNEWTPDNHLRHSEFRRLRSDKTPKSLAPYPRQG